jgi:hypothetical protein
MKFKLVASIGVVALASVHADEGEMPAEKTVEETVLKAVLKELRQQNSCGGVLAAKCTPAAARRLQRFRRDETLFQQLRVRHRRLQDEDSEGEDDTESDDDSDLDEAAQIALLPDGLDGAKACLKKELSGVLDTKSGAKCAKNLNKIHEMNFPDEPLSDELTDKELDRLFASASEAAGSADSDKTGPLPIVLGSLAASAAAGGVFFMARKKRLAGKKSDSQQQEQADVVNSQI